MGQLLEALPRPQAISAWRKTGAHSLLGAEHSEEPGVGKGWEAGKGPSGKHWVQGMPTWDVLPGPHGSWALPVEPRTHHCPGSMGPASLGALQLSSVLVIVFLYQVL